MHSAREGVATKVITPSASGETRGQTNESLSMSIEALSKSSVFTTDCGLLLLGISQQAQAPSLPHIAHPELLLHLEVDLRICADVSYAMPKH
jgi:hypothetical protein